MAFIPLFMIIAVVIVIFLLKNTLAKTSINYMLIALALVTVMDSCENMPENKNNGKHETDTQKTYHIIELEKYSIKDYNPYGLLPYNVNHISYIDTNGTSTPFDKDYGKIDFTKLIKVDYKILENEHPSMSPKSKVEIILPNKHILKIDPKLVSMIALHITQTKETTAYMYGFSMDFSDEYSVTKSEELFELIRNINIAIDGNGDKTDRWIKNRNPALSGLDFNTKNKDFEMRMHIYGEEYKFGRITKPICLKSLRFSLTDAYLETLKK